jgi:hypothetical protein
VHSRLTQGPAEELFRRYSVSVIAGRNEMRSERYFHLDHLWDVLDDPHLNKAGASTKLPHDVPQVPLLISSD